MCRVSFFKIAWHPTFLFLNASLGSYPEEKNKLLFEELKFSTVTKCVGMKRNKFAFMREPIVHTLGTFSE